MTTLTSRADLSDDDCARLREVREHLDGLLDQLDMLGADIAGLHVDAAIVELYRLCSESAGHRILPWDESIPRH